MRVFIAGFCHETSSFSPITTSRKSFESFDYHRPAGNRVDDVCRKLNGYGGFVREAEAQGHDVVASTYAFAQPSGPCARAGYESLRDEILTDLEQAGDVQMVLLFLHGAQMAQGYDDCEGDLIARARAIVGPHVFIGVLLDLHANVTQTMIREASILCACRHYPHIDFNERAVELYRLGVATVSGSVSPVTHFERIPMAGLFYTTEPLMTEANRAAGAQQDREGVLSVSLIHGFLWADIAEMGAGVLVVTDGERAGIAQEAHAVAESFFKARFETRALRKSIGEILDEIEAAQPDPQRRPFVIADACDNAGGGAGSDSTIVLEAILERGLEGFAIGLLWDPVVAQLAEAAGVGSTFKVRLGGKTGPLAGRPLDVMAEVLAIGQGRTQSGIGYRARTGLNAALKIAGNVVIVNDVRGQVFSPTCFTDLGIALDEWRAFVVKSSQHFHAQFAPVSRAVFYCETPGSLSLDLNPAEFHNLQRPIWPVDDVDLGGAAAA